MPLFDTRSSSLSRTPIPPAMAGDTSTGLDGFPLVFENQYIQVRSDIFFAERNFEFSSVGIGPSFGSQCIWPRGGNREQWNSTRRGHRWRRRYNPNQLGYVFCVLSLSQRSLMRSARDIQDPINENMQVLFFSLIVVVLR